MLFFFFFLLYCVTRARQKDYPSTEIYHTGIIGNEVYFLNFNVQPWWVEEITHRHDFVPEEELGTRS